ncbi:MAG: hypothetical protein HY564_02940 [Candidatus Jacksonbacteria bacterium]|nr:hypothetical protein [Candidatus Jacksonbacteria bacterium]
MRRLFIVTAIFLFSLLFTGSPSRVFAITHGTVPLGGKCKASSECARNMGCRRSNLGDFSVCKITVPTTSGCAVDFGENMCADGLVCEDNRCLPTYGLEDLEDGKFSVPIEIPEENPVFNLPDIGSVRPYATLSTGRKIANFILALSLLIGITFGVKGYLTYTTAIGFIPQQRKGFAFLGIGSAVVIASVLLWALFVV